MPHEVGFFEWLSRGPQSQSRIRPGFLHLLRLGRRRRDAITGADSGRRHRALRRDRPLSAPARPQRDAAWTRGARAWSCSLSLPRGTGVAGLLREARSSACRSSRFRYRRRPSRKRANPSRCFAHRHAAFSARDRVAPQPSRGVVQVSGESHRGLQRADSSEEKMMFRTSVAARGDHQDRSRLQPFGRHPSLQDRSCPRSAGRRPLPQGRVDAPDRQPQASAGAFALPLRRCATAGSARARPVIEASSGSTAVSRGLLRADARAAVHRGDAALDQPGEDRADRVLRRQLPPGGRSRRGRTRVPAAGRGRPAATYMDQFTYAERATDWRGNNNIAESIFDQLAKERAPDAELDRRRRGNRRYAARRSAATCAIGGTTTRLCVVDPENSVFFDGWRESTTRPHAPAGLADRGHRPAARRASFIRASSTA